MKQHNMCPIVLSQNHHLSLKSRITITNNLPVINLTGNHVPVHCVCNIPKLYFFGRRNDWSKLPSDLYYLIAEKIRFPPSLHKLALSCREWHSCLIRNPSLFCRKSPTILLPYNRETKSCTFFELDTSNTYTLPINLDNTWICSSSHGWLLTVDSDLHVALFQPLSLVKIELPVPDQAAVLKFKKLVQRSSDSQIVVAISNYLRNAVISESPSLDSNCIVAAILSDSDKIAICQLRDETWSIVNASSCTNNSRKKKEMIDSFEAVAIYERKIYAARRWGSVAIIDYQGPNDLTVTNITEPNDYNVDSVKNKYFVESAGELLFVQRYGTMKRKPGGTFSFEVHKLEKDKQTWTKVRDLKDRVILLGPGGSLSVSTRDVPWFRPNCIYFIDDFYIGESPESSMYRYGPGYQVENVIFSLESNFVEKFDLDQQHILGFWPTPAMWYQIKV